MWFLSLFFIFGLFGIAASRLPQNMQLSRGTSQCST